MFYPGIGVKRWVGLSAFGVVLLIIEPLICEMNNLADPGLDALVVISGIIILILGISG